MTASKIDETRNKLQNHIRLYLIIGITAVSFLIEQTIGFGFFRIPVILAITLGFIPIFGGFPEWLAWKI